MGNLDSWVELLHTDGGGQDAVSNMVILKIVPAITTAQNVPGEIGKRRVDGDSIRSSLR
jgi:hypothetical protein